MNNIVTFNGIGLRFKINNVAISLGEFKIYYYSVFIVIAFIIGIIYGLKNRKKINLDFEDVMILTSIIIVFAIIGARIYYVLFSLKDYLNDPVKMLSISDGGLAIYGGIIGSVLGIAIFCKFTKRDLVGILDFIVPVLPLGQTIGRWGNFFNIEAYGKETTNILRMGIIENGKFIEVHPTFLYESIMCLIIFVVLNILENKTDFTGELCAIYLILYGIVRFFIENLRTDSLWIGSFRVSQILSLILVIIGMIVIGLNKCKKEKI